MSSKEMVKLNGKKLEATEAIFIKENDDVNIKPNVKLIGLTKEQLEEYRNDPFWKTLRYILFALFWIIWLGMFGAALIIVLNSRTCTPNKNNAVLLEKDLNDDVNEYTNFEKDVESCKKMKFNGIIAKTNFNNIKNLKASKMLDLMQDHSDFIIAWIVSTKNEIVLKNISDEISNSFQDIKVQSINSNKSQSNNFEAVLSNKKLNITDILKFPIQEHKINENIFIDKNINMTYASSYVLDNANDKKKEETFITFIQLMYNNPVVIKNDKLNDEIKGNLSIMLENRQNFNDTKLEIYQNNTEIIFTRQSSHGLYALVVNWSNLNKTIPTIQIKSEKYSLKTPLTDSNLQSDKFLPYSAKLFKF